MKPGEKKAVCCCPVARPTAQRTGQTCNCFLALETAHAAAASRETRTAGVAITDEK